VIITTPEEEYVQWLATVWTTSKPWPMVSQL